MENKEFIKRKAFTGVIWKFMERILAQLISMIVTIVLARILTPDDYSVVSIVTIFFTFSNILISSGLNTALIQKKNADNEDYSTVFCVSLCLSIALYFILFFSAPLISSIYQKEILVPVIRVMGLILPINAIKSIACAYISSSLQFKKFFWATLVGTLISGVVGIAMAYGGAGSWALVAQQMTNTIIDTIILFAVTRMHLKFRISLNRLKGLWSYGWKVFLSSLISTLYSEINPLFIGLKYNSSDLSFYEKGRSFPQLISSTTTNTFSAVLFPFLSKFQDDKKEILNYTRRYISLTSYLVFPLMLGFLAVSDGFISLVLTDKWLPASPYVKLFCVSCMFDMINIGNCETVKAIGRSDIFLIMEIVKKTLYFVTIGIFMVFSNSPVMLAMSYVVCTFIAITVNSIPNQKLIGYKLLYQLEDLLPNLIISIIMCLFVIAIGHIKANTIVLLMIQILTGIIIYFLLSLISRNKNYLFIINMARRKIKK